MQERPGQLVRALPLVKEDEKRGVHDPAYSQVSRMQSQKVVQVETKKSSIQSGCKDVYLRKRVNGVEEICLQVSN
jgi:hypothetical protein